MQQIIQESEKTKEVIVQTAKFVMDLKEKRQSLENATEKMLNELKKLRENRSAVEENYEGLESRSEVVRDKINVIDENLKKGADKIKDEVKTFLKNFGLKVKINSFPHSENLVELKIQFTEQHDYRATFVYDPVTEDYDCKIDDNYYGSYSNSMTFQ